jgi:hypothetical protein
MTRSTPIRLIAVLAACGALALAGCGLGSGEGTQGIALTVTRDFGQVSVLDTPSPKSDGQDTVMRLLQRNAKVTTKYGGKFVQSINGIAGANQADWMYYVNGIEAPAGAAATPVHDGDKVWWDQHSWAVTQHIPAVVGSFPAPFLHGADGKRYPVHIECAQIQSKQCDDVSNSLSKLGVVAARNAIGSSFTQHTVRILIGQWSAVRHDITAALLEKGPAASGVFAKPAPDGKSIQILHGNGSPAQTLGAGTGLIAATAAPDTPPVWVVTGTDDAGVTAAASALDEATLKNNFALAISEGRGVHVPEPGP